MTDEKRDRASRFQWNEGDVVIISPGKARKETSPDPETPPAAGTPAGETQSPPAKRRPDETDPTGGK